MKNKSITIILLSLILLVSGQSLFSRSKVKFYLNKNVKIENHARLKTNIKSLPYNLNHASLKNGILTIYVSYWSKTSLNQFTLVIANPRRKTIIFTKDAFLYRTSGQSTGRLYRTDILRFNLTRYKNAAIYLYTGRKKYKLLR